MKKAIFAISVVLALFCLSMFLNSSFSAAVVTADKAEKIVSEKNGDVEIRRVYDDKGRLKAEKRYERGVLQGISKIYFPDGFVSSEEDYRDGQLITRKNFTSNGHLRDEIYYNKEHEITWFEHSANGDVVLIRYYLNDYYTETSNFVDPGIAGRPKIIMQLKNLVLFVDNPFDQKLGKDIMEVIDRLGKPIKTTVTSVEDSSVPGGFFQKEELSFNGLDVIMSIFTYEGRPQGILDGFTVTGNENDLKFGVRIGMSKDDIVSVFGEPSGISDIDDQEHYNYRCSKGVEERSVTFSFVKDKLSAISWLITNNYVD